jgi:hypothetical protein
VRVDVHEARLDVGDAMRVLCGFRFLQQRGALQISLEHNLNQAFWSIGGFLRETADAPARGIEIEPVSVGSSPRMA